MLIVDVSEDKGASRRLEIEKSEIVLGKHGECDVVLTSPKVSRRHARVVEENGALVVEDLKSTNGTSVNGKPIAGPQKLAKGDVIRIDLFEIRVEAAAAPASEAATKPPVAAKPA